MRTRSDDKSVTKAFQHEKKLKTTKVTSPRSRHIQTPGRDDARIRHIQTPGRDDARSRHIQTPGRDDARSRHIHVQTPGRDDVLCSQHFDSQVVVGWDCNSPDALRGIKRISASDQTNDVSDLVKRLIGDESDDEVFTGQTTPPLLGVWRENNKNTLLNDNTSVSYRLRRRGRRRKKSGKDSSVSKDLLHKLAVALDKCTEEDEEADKTDEAFIMEENDASRQHNFSDDLFSSESNNNNEVKTTRVSPRLLEKNRLDCGSKPEERTESCNIDRTKEVADETWSDDELFEEDSFIVKATQLSGDIKKFVSPLFGVKRKPGSDSEPPKSKCSRYTFHLGGDELKASGHKHFTCLQRKQPGNNAVTTSSSSNTLVNSLTKCQTQGIPVTYSISKKPVICQSSVANPTSSQCDNPQKSVISSCAKSVLSNSHASDGQCKLVNNLQVAGQANYLNSQSVSAIGRRQNNVKLLSTQTASTSTNASRFPKTVVSNNTRNSAAVFYQNGKPTIQRAELFKKHHSFSGSNYQCSVSNSSRRRSVSGDNSSNSQSNSTPQTTVLRPSGHATSKALVKATVSRIYPTGVSVSHGINSATTSTTSTVSVKSSTNINSVNSNNKSAVTTESNTYVARNITSSYKSTVSSRSGTHISNRNTNSTGCPEPNNGILYSVNNSKFSKDRYEQGTFKTSLQIVPHQPADQNTATIAISKVRDLKTGFQSRTVPCIHERSSLGGFDASLSDDLLCQLAEPDNLLDSQADFNVPVASVTRVPVNVTNTSISKPIQPVVPTMCSLQTGSSTRNSYSRTTHCAESKPVLSTVCSHVTGSSTLNSYNRPTNFANYKSGVSRPVKQYKFKESQKPTVPAGNISSTRLQGSRQSCKAVEPSHSLTDQSKCDLVSTDAAHKVLEECSEDLFASDDDDILLGDDDDILLNDDDGLTEPQILAMLDEVELLATQQQNSQKCSQTVHHEPDLRGCPGKSAGNTRKSCLGTIVQDGQQSVGKCRNADQAVDLPDGQRLPVGKGRTSDQGTDLSGSQGSSQTKYSVAEIERKKQEALERRKLKSK